MAESSVSACGMAELCTVLGYDQGRSSSKQDAETMLVTMGSSLPDFRLLDCTPVLIKRKEEDVLLGGPDGNNTN